MTQPVFGVPDHQLVLTENENSSSNLSVTYDGSATGVTVVNLGTDLWTVTFTQQITIATDFFAWQEPGDPTHFNYFNAGNYIGAVDFVYSDLSWTGSYDLPPNGFTYIGVGLDHTNPTAPVPIDITFEDGPAVPDTGTTCSFFGLSLMGLAFFRRKFC